jgi:hypothetical protein
VGAPTGRPSKLLIAVGAAVLYLADDEAGGDLRRHDC